MAAATYFIGTAKVVPAAVVAMVDCSRVYLAAVYLGRADEIIIKATAYFIKVDSAIVAAFFCGANMVAPTDFGRVYGTTETAGFGGTNLAVDIGSEALVGVYFGRIKDNYYFE